MTFESWLPCHASGDLPSSSTTQLGARDRARVRLADGERVAGVGLVAVGDDDRRRLDRAASESIAGNGRERGVARSASASASGCSCVGEALADDAEDRVAPRLGHARVAVGLDEPLHAAGPQALGERVPARERVRVAELLRRS